MQAVGTADSLKLRDDVYPSAWFNTIVPHQEIYHFKKKRNLNVVTLTKMQHRN